MALNQAVSTAARITVRSGARVLGRFTHPAAREAARLPAGAGSLDRLAESPYCLLVSTRRDGSPVATPLWFALHDRRIVFRTDASSPKVARLRRNPDAAVFPCDIRGRPRGDAIRVRARLVEDPTEARQIERAIGRRYGIRGRIWNRLVRAARLEAACFELSAETHGAGQGLR